MLQLTVLDEVILGEGLKALSGREALGDQDGSGVCDLLALERSPLDDAVRRRRGGQGAGVS